jgi:cytochrome c556
LADGIVRSRPAEDAAKTGHDELSLQDVVATKFDLNIDQLSLVEVLAHIDEMVIDTYPDLAERFAIRILGNDLKSEGITMNQQIRSLMLKQKTLGELLTAVVRRANPILSARSPSDRRQKLVWTISTAADDAKKIVVLITTRQGAKANGLRLPTVFLADDERDKAKKRQAKPASPPDSENQAAKTVGVSWSQVITAATLEDEVKKILIALQNDVKNPQTFARGGFRMSQRNFAELAVLFGVISEYDKDVRWQAIAEPMARTFHEKARDCRSGTQQTFFKARHGRDTLAALVRGEDVQVADELVGPIDDWSHISDRASLMKRIERSLVKTISKHLIDKPEFVSHEKAIAHEAEILALISTVIRQAGSEDAEDKEYVNHATQLSSAARQVLVSVRKNDLAGARAAVGRIKHQCSHCHEEYR